MTCREYLPWGRGSLRSINEGRTTIRVEGAYPREVLFQALTLFRKVNRLAFKQTRERVEAPALVEGEITSTHVYAALGAVLPRIQRVKAVLNTSEESPVAPLNRWAFRSVQEHGMHALAFLMIGNLGETSEDTEATFEFTAQLRPTSIKLSLAQPYPGTDYHNMAVANNLVDPKRRTHNFIRCSVLRHTQEQELWLGKVRTFFFWYVNRQLRNAGSARFEALIQMLESLPPEKWRNPRVRHRLWLQHNRASREMLAQGATHYTAPFPERPDIVVLSDVVAEQGEVLRREILEPH